MGRAARLLLAFAAGAATCAGPSSQEPLTVRGRVFDEGGRPLAGAGVVLGKAGELLTADALQRPLACSGDDGCFVLRLEDGAGPDRALLLAAKGRAAMLLELREDPARRVSRAMVDAERGVLDFGDLTLGRGVTLHGRVRGEDGGPLAGVTVTAEDLLPRGAWLRERFATVAATSADGIFSLPCAFDRGVELTFTAPGRYRETLSPVSSTSPISVTMRRAPAVAGRVLDPQGSGVRAWLRVDYEAGELDDRFQSGADGAFRHDLALPGRYRLRVAPPEGSGLVATTTQPAEGPGEGIVITLAAAPTVRGLEVTAVDEATGEPVRAFAACAMWSKPHLALAGARASFGWIASRSDAEGRLVLRGPTEGQPRTGALRVVAAGHAPFEVTNLAWDDAKPARVVAKLAPESAVEGRVVDADTGEPVANAWVGYVGNIGPARPAVGSDYVDAENLHVRPPNAVRTDEKGAFRFGSLGKGRYQLSAGHPERPNAEPRRLKLAAGETRRDVVIAMSKGARLTCRLTGAPIDPRWRVSVGRVQKQDVVSTGLVPPKRGSAVSADGSVAFAGLSEGRYELFLLAPAPPRCGPGLSVSLGFAIVRAGDREVRKLIGLSDKLPGTLRGRLTLTDEDVPLERLVVVAWPWSEGPVSAIALPMRFRAPVGRDGSFALTLAPGAHRLFLVDADTKLTLRRWEEAVQVEPGEATTLDLEADVARVRLRLEPEKEGGRVVASRVEVRVWAGGQPVLFQAANYGTRVGPTLAPGQRTVELLAPRAPFTFLVRSPWLLGPLATEEVTPEGRVTEVTVKLPAPDG